MSIEKFGIEKFGKKTAVLVGAEVPAGMTDNWFG